MTVNFILTLYFSPGMNSTGTTEYYVDKQEKCIPLHDHNNTCNSGNFKNYYIATKKYVFFVQCVYLSVFLKKMLCQLSD